MIPQENVPASPEAMSSQPQTQTTQTSPVDQQTTPVVSEQQGGQEVVQTQQVQSQPTPVNPEPTQQPEPGQGLTQTQPSYTQPMEQESGKFYLQFINTPNPQFNKTKIPLEFDVFPSISLGRSPENVIVIPDPEVSRKHAVISFENGKLEIEDLNSTNGTYLYDGKMFQPVKGKVEIQPNSVLKLANNTVIKVVKD